MTIIPMAANIRPERNITGRMSRMVACVEILAGKDGVVRVAKIRVLSNDNRVTILRRSVKHLIPLEVTCDDNTIANDQDQVEKKQTAQESEEEQITTKSKRTAAVTGELVRRLQQT